MMPTSSRSYTVRHYKMTLDGADTSFLKSVDGGQITAEVISGPPENGVRRKQLGPAQIEPFAVGWDLTLDKVVSDWIAQSWENVAKPKDGTIVEFDDGFDLKSERHFHGARILETTIPAMDASSKEGGTLTVKFQPESIEVTTASQTGAAKTGSKSKHTAWLKKDFRFEIGGLDCTQVSKIDSFTIRQIGAEASTDFPNLTVMLPESAAQTWVAWHENFLIKGNTGDERSGALVFLSPNIRTELGRISFFNLGILKIAPERYAAGIPTERGVSPQSCIANEWNSGTATPRLSSGSESASRPLTTNCAKLCSCSSTLSR